MKLKLKHNPHLDSPDVDRIVSVLSNKGFGASRPEAVWLWEQFSESMCAGWLGLPEDDDELFASISEFFEQDD